MSDQVATCGVQISRKRWKTLLISFHLRVYRRDVRKIGSCVAFLSRSLCAARISASTTEALLTFPVTWRPIPRESSEPVDVAGSGSMMYFAGPANDSLSFQQSDERWNNDIDCISHHNLPFLASTSSFGLACDRKTILTGSDGGSSTSVTDFFCLKSEGRVMPASLSRVRLVVFLSLFLLRKYWE